MLGPRLLLPRLIYAQPNSWKLAFHFLRIAVLQSNSNIMAHITRAESIFEFLTEANPQVEDLAAKSKTQTNGYYFWPRRLIKWDDFCFDTLQTVYGGELMAEALRKTSSLPAYPDIILETDCRVGNEGSTSTMLMKWNSTIVNRALLQVRDAFNPCLWKPSQEGISTPKHATPPPAPAPRQTPPRSCKPTHRRSRSSRRYVVDGGTVASSRATSQASQWQEDIEKLPKEYKTGSKWESSSVTRSELVTESGDLLEGAKTTGYMRPIGQAFTYSVWLNCRYGCILTTKEAFLFRISPIEQRHGKPVSGFRTTSFGVLKTAECHADVRDPVQANLLQSTTRARGVMEYISVPWDNNNGGDATAYTDLTINLALWFLHVLAGNRHELAWTYGPLTSEVLATPPYRTPARTPASRDSHEGLIGSEQNPTSLKRRREYEEDAINYSFSKKHSFTMVLSLVQPMVSRS